MYDLKIPVPQNFRAVHKHDQINEEKIAKTQGCKQGLEGGSSKIVFEELVNGKVLSKHIYFEKPFSASAML